MKYETLYSGSNPDKNPIGKYAEKTACKHGNYGTDTFTRKKRATRRHDKQVIKSLVL